MKSKSERGITLATLVVMTILILILVGTGLNISISSAQASNYEVFKTELKIIQLKVNDLSEKDKDKGDSLTVENKEVLNCSEVLEVLSDKATELGISVENIQNGFKLYKKEYINNEFKIDNINRDYLINVEYCIVVSSEGFTYDGTTYYMLEQMGDEGLYNVTYIDQKTNSESGCEVTSESVDDGHKIKIKLNNIQYVSKWEVRYMIDGSSYWKKPTDLAFDNKNKILTFTVEKTGTYKIKVNHGDEINLESQITI